MLNYKNSSKYWFTFVSHRQIQGTIYYTFKVVNCEDVYLIQDRYSKLREIHDLCCKKHKMPEFPEKKFWNSTAQWFIAKRKKDLMEYYNTISRIFGIDKLVPLYKYITSHKKIAPKKSLPQLHTVFQKITSSTLQAMIDINAIQDEYENTLQKNQNPEQPPPCFQTPPLLQQCHSLENNFSVYHNFSQISQIPFKQQFNHAIEASQIFAKQFKSLLQEIKELDKHKSIIERLPREGNNFKKKD